VYRHIYILAYFGKKIKTIDQFMYSFHPCGKHQQSFIILYKTRIDTSKILRYYRGSLCIKILYKDSKTKIVNNSILYARRTGFPRSYRSFTFLPKSLPHKKNRSRGLFYCRPARASSIFLMVELRGIAPRSNNLITTISTSIVCSLI